MVCAGCACCTAGGCVGVGATSTGAGGGWFGVIVPCAVATLENVRASGTREAKTSEEEERFMVGRTYHRFRLFCGIACVQGLAGGRLSGSCLTLTRPVN